MSDNNYGMGRLDYLHSEKCIITDLSSGWLSPSWYKSAERAFFSLYGQIASVSCLLLQLDAETAFSRQAVSRKYGSARSSALLTLLFPTDLIRA